MKNKTTLFIIIIIILSLIVTCLGIHIYKISTNNENDFEKYYRIKTEAFATNNLNASKGQIVFIGDSITDLCPLDDYYNDLPLATYNRGIGGDTTAGLLKRLDISVLQINPAKIVLLIGANDINGGVSEEDILKNYREILNTITDKLPETEICMMSIIPQNHDIETYSEIDVDKTTPIIISLNEKLKEMSEEYNNVIYIDLFSELKDKNNFLIKEYSDDGIHLNGNGFKVWADVLKPYIK